MIVPNCKSYSFDRFMGKFFPEKKVLNISHRPKSKYLPNDCYENVKKHISQNGGDIVYGWSIWEWPQVFIEAFHHALWKNPKGRLIDISPDDTTLFPYRLFVEEPDAIFADEMPRYQNKRMLLNDDPLIGEFITTCEEFDKALAQINPGQYGYVTETPELMLIRLKRDNLQREIRQKYP